MKKNTLIKKKSFMQRLKEDKWYLIFILPAIVYLFVVCYRPLYGCLMAFQISQVGDKILAFDGSVEWGGL